MKTALRLADLYGALKQEDDVRRVLERGLEADATAPEIRKRLLALYEKQKAWAELANLVKGDAEAAKEPAEQGAPLPQGRRDPPAEAQRSGRRGRPPGQGLRARAHRPRAAPRALRRLQRLRPRQAGGRGAAEDRRVVRRPPLQGARRPSTTGSPRRTSPRARRRSRSSSSTSPSRSTPARSRCCATSASSRSSCPQTRRRQGREAHIDRAQKTFRALLLQKLDDSSPISKGEVFYYLADISHRQNDDKKAVQMLERSLDANKEYAPAKELLAKLKK